MTTPSNTPNSHESAKKQSSQPGANASSWADDPVLSNVAGSGLAGTRAAECERLQEDVSSFVDGELSRAVGKRVVEHIDACADCSNLLEELRAQVRAHRDLQNADKLMARFGTWTGDGFESIELKIRLTNIFYQLGKAYVLASMDTSTRQRVFERPTDMGATQVSGRGFVDGVLASGRGESGGVNWRSARGMLNGQLAKIETSAEKGRALLNEAQKTDSAHDESKLYLAVLNAQDGQTIRAAEDFRELMQTASDVSNKGHAAMQLGLLLAAQREFRRAIACFRLVIRLGLADENDGFFVARFNVGIYYAHLRDQSRSLSAFRGLLDRHPGRVTEVADLFLHSEKTRRVIESQDGFVEALAATCPELFGLGSQELR